MLAQIIFTYVSSVTNGKSQKETTQTHFLAKQTLLYDKFNVSCIFSSKTATLFMIEAKTLAMGVKQKSKTFQKIMWKVNDFSVFHVRAKRILLWYSQLPSSGQNFRLIIALYIFILADIIQYFLIYLDRKDLIRNPQHKCFLKN